ncbi:acyltransferase family protein [Sphingomicrobium sp. XHP0235]|uniref:acyltransferase family protein n=1 Tax=Sphingomicrobium aquimarinum TaxID=3133971 RepID=UPI0031FE7900
MTIHQDFTAAKGWRRWFPRRLIVSGGVGTGDLAARPGKPPQEDAKHFYRPEIDGLRALAVLPVMLFHAGIAGFEGGFVGVDVFFVISGYLITTIILNEVEEGRFSIAKFYERRARRILPALFFVIACCVPFAWWLMSPAQMADFGMSLFAVAFFASNILFAQDAGYFSLASEEKPLLHTWSLAVEEQFYLVAPFLFLFGWRFLGRHGIWLILALAAGSLGLAHWMEPRAPWWNFYLAPTRAFELFGGSIAAYLLRERGVLKNELLGALGLAMILASILIYDGDTPFPGVAALLPVGGTMLVIACAGAGTWAARLLSVKAIVAVGLISYSAYLWHQPLFAFARIAMVDAPGPGVMLGLTAASLGLAWLSWRIVERPFRQKGVLSARAIWRFSGAGLLAMILLAWGAVQTEGFKAQRFAGWQQALMAQSQRSPMREACHSEPARALSYADACIYGGDGPARVAVMGDSHAVELAHGVAEVVAARGERVRHMTFMACPPSYRNLYDDKVDCARWTDSMVAGMLADAELETVVVSYRMNKHLFAEHRFHYPQVPDEIGSKDREAVWSSFLDMLEVLQAGGKKVVWVRQVPELSELVELRIGRASNSAGVTGVPRAWWDARRAWVDARLNEVPADVTIVDATETFCDASTCYAARSGTSDYFDDNHLSVGGARRVAGLVAPHLR